MNRSDSGFEDFHFVRHPKGVPSSDLEHHATSSTSPGTPTFSSKSPTISEAIEPNVAQQMSEKDPYAYRRSRDQRRKSVQSSTNTSTKSRDRGYSSKPSSRRTSCTLVDPSRPARHYRIKSPQSVPTVNRDIDDVLALHFRSCSLFHSSTYHSKPYVSEPKEDNTVLANDSPVFHAITCPTPHHLSDAIRPITHAGDSPLSGANTDNMDTVTTHWMSPSTRRREYEKIDRAHGGVRGLVRRVLPRSLSGPPPPRFYEKDRSDVGSVRRYRMDVSDDDADDDDEEVDEKDVEKSTSLLRRDSHKVESSTRPKTPGRSKSDGKGQGQMKGKRWGCF